MIYSIDIEIREPKFHAHSGSDTSETVLLAMRLSQPLGFPLLAAAVLISALFGSAASFAQTIPGKAEVRSVKGQAVYSVGNAPPMRLKVGTVLPSGAIVKTGPNTTVDLFLGRTAGTVRVTENSILSLEKLTLTATGVDTVVEVQLNLSEGQMLGNVNKLSAASKYEIKVPNGVAGIRGTRFRCRSNSEIVLLNGILIFVYVPPGGQPVPFTLRAPPAVEFSPVDGIKPAAVETVQEVLRQFGPQPRAAQDFEQRPQQAQIEPFVSPTIGAPR
jgi:hypothetical protein